MEGERILPFASLDSIATKCRCSIQAEMLKLNETQKRQSTGWVRCE